jgi:hypothetical protein
MSTTRDTNTASDSLIRLKTSLSVSISSLKARNDKLESHLKRTGWTIRRMAPRKAGTKDSNRP